MYPIVLCQYVWAVHEFDGVAIVDGDLDFAAEAGAGDFTFFGDAEEADTGVQLAIGGAPAAVSGAVVGDSLGGDLDGLFHGVAAADVLDDQIAGTGEEVELAQADGAAGADGVVEIETGAEDWGIADAAGDLESEPGGGGDTGEITVGVHDRDVDGAGDSLFQEFDDLGIFFAGAGREPVVSVFFLPGEPAFAGLFGEHFHFWEAVSPGEASGAVANDEDVFAALHDEAGDGGWVEDVADRGDGTATVGCAVHDGRVELNHAVFVGHATVADGVVGGVGLDDRNADDGGVEWVVAFLEEFHDLVDNVGAGVARSDQGPHCPRFALGLGTDGERGQADGGGRLQEHPAIDRVFHVISVSRVMAREVRLLGGSLFVSSEITLYGICWDLPGGGV